MQEKNKEDGQNYKDYIAKMSIQSKIIFSTIAIICICFVMLFISVHSSLRNDTVDSLAESSTSNVIAVTNTDTLNNDSEVQTEASVKQEISYSEAYDLLVWFYIYINNKQYEEAYKLLHSDYVKDEQYTEEIFANEMLEKTKGIVLFQVKEHSKIESGHACKVYYIYSNDGITNKDPGVTYLSNIEIIYDEVVGDYKIYPIVTKINTEEGIEVEEVQSSSELLFEKDEIGESFESEGIELPRGTQNVAN